MQRFSRVRQAFVLVLAVALIACGGGGDTSGRDSGEGGGGDQVAGGAGDETAAAAGALDSHVTVTVGDRRFEVDPAAGNNSCGTPMEGVFLAAGFTDDADPSSPRSETRTEGARVHVSLSENEDELNRSQVTVEDFSAGVEWWADPSRGGEVEAWSLDGSTITGTAVFVDTDAERIADLEGETYEPVTGTFEIVCDFG